MAQKRVSDPCVGFIGLGNMGFPMARNLLKAGYPLCCLDVRPEPVRRLVEEGAAAGSSPADVGRRSDIVFTMLPTSAAVESVVLGDSGVIAGLRAGGTVVDMSTVSPVMTKKVAAALAARKIRMLDAPVGRGAHAAAEGTLTIMVGGDPKVVDECRPLLSKMGSTIHYCGQVGTGATVKVVNNLVGGAVLTVVAEALAIGIKAGIDPALMIKVFDTTAASNYHLKTTFGTRVLARNFTPGFTIKLMRKDFDIIHELAESVGVPTPIAALVSELYATAIARGYGDDDFAGYVRLLEETTGARFESRGG